MKLIFFAAVLHFCNSIPINIADDSIIVDAGLKFNRNEFRMMRDYMDEIYSENPNNSTEWKWFNTDKHAYGYVSYDKLHDSIIIAFRGTITKINMVQNFKLDLIPYSACSSTASSKCKVHKGFLETYDTAKQYVLHNFKLFHNLYPNAKIYVTGYSLGAAQASLCAVELSLLGHQVNLMTFGSPRVGSKEFADFANINLTGTNIRISYGNDAVTAMPIRAIGYWHIGTEVNFDNKNEIKIEAPKYSDKTFMFRPYNLLDHFRENYVGIN